MERNKSQNQAQNQNQSQGREREEQGTSRQASGGRSTQENNPGNFANDRERAAEAGRKGGQNSHGGRLSQNDDE